MGVQYVQTSGKLTTTSGDWTPIDGLSLTLPEGVDVEAVVILNLPNPYAAGDEYPGALIGIAVDGKVSETVASFTYSEQAPAVPGRMPTTLVVGVPLTLKPQTVTAMWQGVRGSTVIIDSPSSLSVID